MTHDMWRGTHMVWWILSQHFRSLAVTVWEKRCFVDIGWFHIKAPRKIWRFLFGFLTTKVKSFWYFSNKNFFFLLNFCYFWPLLEFFKDFYIFKGFKNEIFNIMFYYYIFQVKNVIPSVTGQNHFKYLLFLCF